MCSPARFTAALTTTQRRLKRLSDAALVGRFQFHRRDGGGAPMCYAIAPQGLELLCAHGRLDAAAWDGAEARDPSPKSLPPSPSRSSAPPAAAGAGMLRQARHEVRVTGWALALERALGGAALRLRGPKESVLSPPLRSGSATDPGHTVRRAGAASVAIGPADLRLPGGRTPHDFLRTDSRGERVEVERFETVRPDSSAELPPAPGGTARVAGTHLLIELDDRLCTRSPQPAVAKLERYDHMLAGWSVCVPRFAGPPGGRAWPNLLVVFLCRDRSRARECARRADHLLGACRAYAGEHPRDWEYPGRSAIVFASERDAHEGLLGAYGVPSLPPAGRAAAAGGDPGAGEATVEARALLPGAGPR
jgi:hypothetical protein